MQIERLTETARAQDGELTLNVLAPRDEAAHSGILLYADIFNATPSTLRIAARLAGHGYTVVVPDLYRRIEPPLVALDFEADRQRALDDAARTHVAEFDADRETALAFMRSHPRILAERIGAIGFCIGGHLAFRAALSPHVRAAVCAYPTGVHDGVLGADTNVDSLARAGDIRGELSLVFGTRDPHVPEGGRARIAADLRAAGVRYTLDEYDADHAFMRDEGPRYDAQATDAALGRSLDLFARTLA